MEETNNYCRTGSIGIYFAKQFNRYFILGKPKTSTIWNAISKCYFVDKQIKSNEIYLTNRDYIYTACVEYIRGRVGLPGGFGIPLYITSGEYYYAHNVVLQFLTFSEYGNYHYSWNYIDSCKNDKVYCTFKV